MKQGEITTSNVAADSKKDSYQKPLLVELGDLRVLTQSGMSGAMEGSSGSTSGMMS